MQFAGKNSRNFMQKYPQLQVKTATISGKRTQMQAILPSHHKYIHLQIAGKLACTLQVKLPAACLPYYVVVAGSFGWKLHENLHELCI